MRAIADKLRGNAVEYRRKMMKYKYPKGVELAVVGNGTDGYFLIIRCLKKKRWHVLGHRKERRSSIREMIPFLDFLSEMSRLIEKLKEYGVKASQNTTVRLDNILDDILETLDES